MHLFTLQKNYLISSSIFFYLPF